jgi:hypothetical protein
MFKNARAILTSPSVRKPTTDEAGLLASLEAWKQVIDLYGCEVSEVNNELYNKQTESSPSKSGDDKEWYGSLGGTVIGAKDNLKADID